MAICGIGIGERILLDDREFVVRGVDPIGVPAARIYLEDTTTGELTTALLGHVRALDNHSGNPDQRR